MKKKLFSLIIAILFAAGAVSSQTRIIHGVITNSSDGSVIQGVSISIKGSNKRTLSDQHGNYSIEIPGPGTVLVFSFIGMITQEISPRAGNRLDVTMDPDIVSLEEVIVMDREYAPLRETSVNGARMHYKREQVSQPAYYAPPQDFNTESYSAIRETGFKDVLTNPLSTFSIDVDKASYANMRRFINSGQLPPPDAVRVEELLNYFSYNYAQPRGRHPYAMHTELSHCPWNPQTQLLHVGLKGREIEKFNLPNSNLVFLVDVSGSMQSSNKLPLAQMAMKMLVDELRSQDRVSLVVYSGRAEVVLESTPASNKRVIVEAIDRLVAGGSTAGGQAMRMAYEVAEENFIDDGNNRIIMCTDGDFNVGESSNAAMERLVEDKRKKGVFITVLGFGMGNYKDDRLEIIANKGNGNYGYIDNMQEARKTMVSEFAGTLFTIAKDVKLQIEFNPARVKAYRLIGYENRRLNDEDFNDDAKDAGEMGAGHSVTALYEIVPAGSDVSVPGVDPLKYQSNPQRMEVQPDLELLTIKTRYKRPDGGESVLFDMAVSGQVLPLGRTTDDFRFAAAVAEFGLILSQSGFKSNASFENALDMALKARGEDQEGYRAEFINLVRTASSLSDLSIKRE